jgi:hypothetical protein
MSTRDSAQRWGLADSPIATRNFRGGRGVDPFGRIVFWMDHFFLDKGRDPVLRRTKKRESRSMVTFGHVNWCWRNLKGGRCAF